MPNFKPNNVTMQNSMTGAIPTEFGTLIIDDVIGTSSVMQMATYEPMTKPTKKFYYEAGGIGAYWVDEASPIQTDKPKWLEITMNTKKLGVIVPVSKETLRYSKPDFFEFVKPLIADAFAKKFDRAAMWGENTPFGSAHSMWGNIQASGNSLPTSNDTYRDLSNLLGLVEEEEISPDGFLMPTNNRKLIRDTLDTTGRPIFNDATQGAPAQLLGYPLATPRKGVWDATKATIITGDFDSARYSILQDIEYEISTEATITTVADDNNNPISLFERDMAALRATMQVGFMIIRQGSFAAITPVVTP